MTNQTNTSYGDEYPIDGMGAMINITWDCLPIMIEPGVPFAAYGGLTSEEVADAINEELLSTQSLNQQP